MTILFFPLLFVEVPNTSLYFWTLNLVSDLGIFIGDLLLRSIPVLGVFSIYKGVVYFFYGL